jgi:hypothetical protein
MKTHVAASILLFLISTSSFAQTDYNNLSNWAFHPNKTGTLIDNFNLDIAVIDENLNTTSIIQNTNNAMTNTGVDVFFIHPTILVNMASYTTIETVPISSQNTVMVSASIRGQAGLLAKYGRMFAPRYRQATPPTFLFSPLDSNQANVIGVAYNDVKGAFLHYLNNYNKGNKIIIASHSQGAILASMLLRDVFDGNPQLINKLVVAVVAGIASNYAPLNGGWWQNIPFCSQQNECACVMSWKSYKAGQIPPIPNNSHPALNPIFLSNNWVYNQLNLSQDWFYQDSIYYDDNYSSLQNLITLKSNVSFGPSTVGYVAFDNMYQIKYLRAGAAQVGFVVQYTPSQNDLRPNILEDEESNPAFANLGYHQKDYNIYTWALMNQIDLKLNSCGILSNRSNDILSNNAFHLYPNPTNGILNIKIVDAGCEFETIIFNQLGQTSHKSKNQNQIDMNNYPNGIYFVTIKTNKQIVTKKIIKE